MKYNQLISHFRGRKILVIGDLILDQHIVGSVNRISPEAPVPVVLQQGEPSFSPGGAANVAQNLRCLGAQVTLLGKIGSDLEGRELLRQLKKAQIPCRGVVVDRGCPTVLKTRIMAHHQQVLRLDRESVVEETPPALKRRVNTLLEKYIPKVDGVILSDYGKGMITRQLVEQTCYLALKYHKIITVDPKVEHFAYYRGVTAITPNKNEAENAIRNIKITQTGSRRLDLHSDRLSCYSDVERAAKQLVKFLELESMIITLGEQGMCLVEKGRDPVHIETRAQEVFDVTGAGDTVIAVFTLALSAGATKKQAADLANFAAGIVVGKMGAVSVTRQELWESVKSQQ